MRGGDQSPNRNRQTTSRQEVVITAATWSKATYFGIELTFSQSNNTITSPLCGLGDVAPKLSSHTFFWYRYVDWD